MTNACIGSSNMRGTSFNMPGVPSGGLEESPMLPEFIGCRAARLILPDQGYAEAGSR